MSVHEYSRSVPFGAITTWRLVSLAERALLAATKWRNARATAAVLSSLTNQQLADIGLHRGEIRTLAARLARA